MYLGDSRDQFWGHSFCHFSHNETLIAICRDPGLNQGPLDLQSNALPAELFRLTSMGNCCGKKKKKVYMNTHITNKRGRQHAASLYRRMEMNKWCMEVFGNFLSWWLWGRFCDVDHLPVRCWALFIVDDFGMIKVNDMTYPGAQDSNDLSVWQRSREGSSTGCRELCFIEEHFLFLKHGQYTCAIQCLVTQRLNRDLNPGPSD